MCIGGEFGIGSQRSRLLSQWRPHGFINHTQDGLSVDTDPSTENERSIAPGGLTGASLRAVGSQYALGVQLLHFRLAEAEPAEDFNVVLAELGGDTADPHAFATFDRGANVRHLTQFRFARLLDDTAVAPLRVGEQLRVIIDWAA